MLKQYESELNSVDSAPFDIVRSATAVCSAAFLSPRNTIDFYGAIFTIRNATFAYYE